MSDALIELRQLDFSYPAAPPLFEKFDFTLRSGDRVAFTGHNGSGKSTLLHIITGLLRPAGGSIRVFGTARRQESDFRDVRRRVGYVLQDSDDQLFCPTVLDDVMFGPLNFGLSREAARVRAIGILERLGLARHAERVTYKLSGGEKRLVALAAVLAMEPDVLLLDEPTAGLDERTEKRLTEILRETRQDMILVSHNRLFVDQLATRSVSIGNQDTVHK